jgi:Zn-dependent peptidase ImmA (M78 family)
MQTTEKIKRVARNFVFKNNIQIPISINHIAKIVKAAIIYYKFPKNMDGDTLKIAKGFTIKGAEDAEYLIIVNTLHSDTRKRFTIAHEIAHILLKHHEKRVLYQLSDNVKVKEMENIFNREADIFAAELLMPAAHVSNIVNNYKVKDVEVLSDYYKVSKSAMEIKIKEEAIA